MNPVIKIRNLSKLYPPDIKALNNVSLDIKKGEIFGLLGPNGAGKTTMIEIICGLVNRTNGEVTVMGKDVIKDYRFTRRVIGLVPQEIVLDIFMTVYDSVAYQRGYFGLRKDNELIYNILNSLTLWDKRNAQAKDLSGGMKRRLMIAKALVHEPEIVFLDEPTAGVDVQLRKDLWSTVKKINKKGSTIILTTHYIEEAEQMADRIGIINQGELKLIDDKEKLIERLGGKEMIIHLKNKIDKLPKALRRHNIKLMNDKKTIRYLYPSKKCGFEQLNADLKNHGIKICDIDTARTSLEEIFIKLINNK